MTLDFLAARAAALPNLLRAGMPEYQVDDEIESVVDALQRSNPLPLIVTPYEIVNNLRDVGVLLDRLLGYRRELQAIQSEQIRSALSYISAVEIAEADRAVELAKAGGDAGIEAKLNAKLKAVKDSVQALEQRHALPGHSLNYVDRMDRLRSQMRSDIQSCFCRSRALEDGTSLLGYEVRLPMPATGKLTYADAASARFVDDWVAWHRRISQALEIKQGAELIHEVSLSLGQSDYLTAWSPGPPRVLMAREVAPLVPNLLAAIQAYEDLRFELTDEILLLEKNAPTRLRAFAVSVVLADAADAKWLQFTSKIQLPGEQRPFQIPAHVRIGELRWVSGDGVQNRSVTGDWQLNLNRSPLRAADQANRERLLAGNWPIIDVQLHLRFSAN